MQVRILSRRARSPYARRWKTRTLLFNPSTKPSATLFSGRQYAAIPTLPKMEMGEAWVGRSGKYDVWGTQKRDTSVNRFDLDKPGGRKYPATTIVIVIDYRSSIQGRPVGPRVGTEESIAHQRGCRSGASTSLAPRSPESCHEGRSRHEARSHVVSSSPAFGHRSIWHAAYVATSLCRLNRWALARCYGSVFGGS